MSEEPAIDYDNEESNTEKSIESRILGSSLEERQAFALSSLTSTTTTTIWCCGLHFPPNKTLDEVKNEYIEYNNLPEEMKEETRNPFNSLIFLDEITSKQYNGRKIMYTSEFNSKEDKKILNRFKGRMTGKKTKWNKWFEDLVQHHTNHGTFFIESICDRKFVCRRSCQRCKLRMWVNKQLQLYKEGNLCLYKCQKLRSIGFFDGLEENPKALQKRRRKTFSASTSPWSERIEELIEYKNRFGNVNIPFMLPSNPSLSLWAENVRCAYNAKISGKTAKMKLSDNLVSKLNELGFIWEKQIDTDPLQMNQLTSRSIDDTKDIQNENTKCSTEFETDGEASLSVDKHNDGTNESTNDDENLEASTAPQKKRRKIFSTLTSPWSERIEELTEYKNRFGDVNIPPMLASNPSLSLWVDNVRCAYKAKMNGETAKLKLSDDLVSKLNELGFVWEKHHAMSLLQMNELTSRNADAIKDKQKKNNNCMTEFERDGRFLSSIDNGSCSDNKRFTNNKNLKTFTTITDHKDNNNCYSPDDADYKDKNINMRTQHSNDKNKDNSSASDPATSLSSSTSYVIDRAGNKIIVKPDRVWI